MEEPYFTWKGITRRDFIKYGSLAFVAVACGQTTDTTDAPTATTAPAAGPVMPETTFVEPTTAVSGELKILLWSHFVPSHDEWFDPFAEEWGNLVGVDVTVDHIGVGDVPAAIAAEIQSGDPEHDLMQYIAVLSQHEPSVVDMGDVLSEAESRYGNFLDLTRKSSFNPNTGKFYSYAPAWVPDPGDYRKRSGSRTDRRLGMSYSRVEPRFSPMRAFRRASECPRRSTPTWPGER